jgi:hypothetical protein
MKKMEKYSDYVNLPWNSKLALVKSASVIESNELPDPPIIPKCFEEEDFV